MAKAVETKEFAEDFVEEVKAEEKNEDLYNALKAMRLRLAKKENVPAYYIFNNKTLDDLVEKKPKNKEELMKVYGFSEVKIGKYGDEVLGVLSGGK